MKCCTWRSRASRGREAALSASRERRDALGWHLLGLGVGAGLILSLTLLIGLPMVNFH